MDEVTLAQMIRFAETALKWAGHAGPSWSDDEQVRAAVAMYVGQVGEIINREVSMDEIASAPEVFGELSGFRNKIYHHYYRDFRIDILRATVDDELPDKLARWKQMQSSRSGAG